MRLFVYTGLDDTSRRELLDGLPTDVTPVFRNDLPEADWPAAFRSAELLLGNPPADWFADPPARLTYWQLDSAGFDAYRAVRVRATVCNMGDYFAWPCAETIVAGIMALYRHIDELVVLQQESRWAGSSVRKRLRLLRGQRVIILGAGTIGQAVRQILTGFGCRLQLMARSHPDATLRSTDDLLRALPETDLVVNCLPGSASGFFTAGLIEAMQQGSVFANVGRGSTVDEPALIDALQRGQLGGAVLDVTATEPLPADSPLWTLPNVLLTQHTAGGQPNEDSGKAALFLRNLHRLRRGETPDNPIDLARGY